MTVNILTVTILIGDILDRAGHIDDASINLVLTSSRPWPRRAYQRDGHPGKDHEIGTQSIAVT